MLDQVLGGGEKKLLRSNRSAAALVYLSLCISGQQPTSESLFDAPVVKKRLYWGGRTNLVFEDRSGAQ